MPRLTSSLSILLLCLASAAATGAQDPFSPQNFEAHVRTLYDFSPHQQSEEALKQKSAEMDKFWHAVKANPKHYLPRLRTALRTQGYPSFFYYDGAKLLLSLSKRDTDAAIALGAIPHVDMRDVQHTDYLITVHALAVRGLDTTTAALHVLDAPNFRATIAQHALTLGQDYALALMLLPTKEQYYEQRILDRARIERDPKRLKSLLLMLWYLDTEAARLTIAQIRHNTNLPEAARKIAGSMINHHYKLREKVDAKKAQRITGMLQYNGKIEYEAIKAARRARLTRISDEALIELDQYTVLLKSMRPLAP